MTRKANRDSQTHIVQQVEKFQELARELECDEDEAAFKAKLRKVASAPRAEKPPKGDGDR